MAAKTGNASLYLRYLETGQHADFVIECQGVEFNVHRIIVCAKSDMLDRAAGGHFQEAEQCRINLGEIDPLTLSRVLLFLYGEDYLPDEIPAFFRSQASQFNLQATAGDNDETISALNVHALVYKCADMLCIESLKKKAAKRFLDLAKSKTTSPEFATPLKLMYESTRSDDELLRLPATKMCLGDHWALLYCDEVKDIISKYEPYVWDIACHLQAKAETLEEEAREEEAQSIINMVNMARRCRYHPYKHVGDKGSYALSGRRVVALCHLCVLTSRNPSRAGLDDLLFDDEE